jgi:uncharacterized damage-inducible protein DinB
MYQSVAGQLSDRMQQINGQLIGVLQGASDEQLRWQHGLTTPSIGFHVWHIARWSDRNQALLASLEDNAGAGSEIWVAGSLAERWGLATESLGVGETGLGMSDEAATGLALPAKAELLDYVQETLDLLDQRYAAVDDSLLGSELSDANGRPSAVAAILLSHLTHASRHLGMIEALRGVQGQHGTASA